MVPTTCLWERKVFGNCFFPTSCAAQTGRRNVNRIGEGMCGQCSVEEEGRIRKEGMELAY